MATYYHNPRCSKSREGLKLLNDANFECTIVEYLKEGLTKEDLQKILRGLNKTPPEMIRTKESVYKENKLKDKDLSEEEWIEEIIRNPILLERPILVNNSKAIIGRPPEDLLTII